jgi:hypothetical protein
LPPATPQVQVERPQRSEDERPGGAAKATAILGREEGPMGPSNSPLKPQLRTNPRTTA